MKLVYLILLFVVIYPNPNCFADKHVCKRKLLAKLDRMCAKESMMYDEFLQKGLSQKKAKENIRDFIKKGMRKTCARHCGKKVGISCNPFSSTIKKKYISCKDFHDDLSNRLDKVQYFEAEDIDDIFQLLLDGEFERNQDSQDLLI